ncbi:MAG: sulfate reduction electron transfer complex DsrMKJOP subunit DsrM [Acidobacteriota bacterium]|jgi:nitrate reductase gamma subunit
MYILYSLLAVLVLAALGYIGGDAAVLRPVFAVAIPYAAIVLFLGGLVYRIAKWAASAVPFRIPTTCGQQKSLPWIKAGRLENPSGKIGAFLRLALEVLLFRSLFRNTRSELRSGPKLVYGENKLLWLGAIAFHYTFLIVFLRHLRFFMEPVPAFVNGLAAVDGFFQIGAPGLYVTDVILLAALAYLLWRRLRDPQVRYVSLFQDYFALFLLLGLVCSGILMRYFTRVDLLSIKELAMGLVTFHPVIPKQVGPLFFVHLFMLSLLVAYFPFSKLMHMGGIFLSPTRNLPNNNRMKRHINPWNYPVKVHTYAEWEDEFHDKIKAAGLPLERE